MYYFAKLCAASIQFISAIMSMGVNRSKAWAIAVGYVLARELPLPVERVEDIVTYYRLHAQLDAFRLLDMINELVPMDTAYAKTMIESSYLQRYNALYPPEIPLALREGKGLVDFFGLSRVFSEDTLEEICCNSAKITNYITGITGLVKELTAVTDHNPQDQTPEVSFYAG